MKKGKLVLLVAIIMALLALPQLVACSQPSPAPAPAPSSQPATKPPAPSAPSTTATVASPPASSGKTYTLLTDYSSYYGVTSYQEVFKPGGILQRELYRQSNGRLLLDIKDRIFALNEIVSGISMGKADLGFFSAGTMAGSFPIFRWGAIPSLLRPSNSQEQLAVETDPRYLDLYDKYCRTLGLVYLFSTTSVANDAIWSKDKKISTLEDFKGQKLRAVGLDQEKVVETFGGSPVTIATAEIEQALYTGTVSGVVTSLVYGYGRGLTDLVKYISMWPITPTHVFPIIMNAKTYDSLPPDLQQVLRKVGLEIQRQQYYAIQFELEMAIAGIKRTKVEIITPSDAETKRAEQLATPLQSWWFNEKIAKPFGPDLLAIVKDDIAKYRDQEKKLLGK